MSLSSLLADWHDDPSVAGNVVARRLLPAADGRFAPMPADVHPRLAAALAARGIHALYAHQAQAWDHLKAGRHVVVVTGTASGKTLCYNLPVLDAVLRQPEDRALYIFPTRALAQDQRDELTGLLGQDAGLVPCAVYDGDTPAGARAAIRRQAAIVLTNPDMLHTGILPHHTLWASFFRRLRYVVLDEMHVYRGVFGSHVVNLLRRLSRVAEFYGGRPRFVLTSATIGNPGDLAARLVEDEVALVDDDGASRGARHFLVYNPPLVDAALGIRRPLLGEAARLAGDLREHGVQTILFARARRSVEILVRTLQHGAPADSAGQIRGYRGGYLPGQRRTVEAGLRQGQVRVVAATNALELGIDIGGMGAALLAGYPGSSAAMWQQAGRAGRGREEALAVLLTSADPLDQFLARNPAYLFGRAPEHALVNPDNLIILLQHIRCAAFELPFRDGDRFGAVAPALLTEYLELLAANGVLHRSGDRFFWMADQYPAESVSLRSASAETVALQAEGRVIGQVDLASANWMVHPQAIYLHEGRSYLVESLDLAGKLASLRPCETDYYTEPRSETTVQLLDVAEEAAVPGGRKTRGEIAVTTTVTGFRKVRWFTNEQLGDGPVTLPPTEMHTTAYWLSLGGDTVATLRDQGLWGNDANEYGPGWPELRDAARARDGWRCVACGLPEAGAAHHVHHRQPFRTFGARAEANTLDNLVTLCPACHQRAELAVRVRSGLAGLAYVLRGLAPLFLLCDARDIGVHSDPRLPLASGDPGVVIYDQVPAGIGFADRLFAVHNDLVARALEAVRGCDCADGCPSCVGPAGEQGEGGKAGTLAILTHLQFCQSVLL